MQCREVLVRIETGNDAFVDRVRSEVARILRKAASQLADDVKDPPLTLMDSNGNTVGELTIR